MTLDVYTKRFPVIEIFGPTIQGEGPQVGTRAAFIRFGGCDYRCAWCDSAPAVLPDEVRFAQKMTALDIVKRVQRIDVPLVVISGGNPVLHDLHDVVAWLHDAHYKVSVETQGTLYRTWLNSIDQLVVSPKPPSSDMSTSIATLQTFLHKTRDVPTAIKVPCFDKGDVTFANQVAGAFPGYDMFLSVVTRMGGLYGTFDEGHIDTTDEILKRYVQVIEWAHEFPFLSTARILPQIHALAWGHERGH